jgi:hypothetical protein
MNHYEIRPRERGPGVGLTDSSGHHADLWFRNAEAALEYAVFSARRDGGTIRVYGNSGILQLEREVRGDTHAEKAGLFRRRDERSRGVAAWTARRAFL